MKKLAFVALSLLALTGCTNRADYYQTNHPTPASVRGSFERNGLFAWKKATIVSIDNKRPSYGFFDSGIDAKLPIDPGVHTFVVNVEFSRGFGDGPYTGLIETTALFRPGASYKIEGTYQGNKALGWVAMESGRRVSPVNAAPYQYIPQRTVIMPIVVN